LAALRAERPADDGAGNLPHAFLTTTKLSPAWKASRWCHSWSEKAGAEVRPPCPASIS
jgi:hypothetical protein